MAELNCPLREASDISPHENALVAGESEISFPELDIMVSIVARRLRDAGLNPGDRVGLFLPQDEHLVALFLACLRIGLVACPINIRWPRAMVVDALRRVGAAAVIAQGGGETVDGIRRLDPAPLTIPGGEPIAWSGRMAIDRPATIIFTSGSTGRPKAALHSYGNHYYSARGANTNIRLASRDRWLLSLPLYHVGGIGILFRCLLAGATVVIPRPGLDLSASVAEDRLTHLSLVTTQLQRLLAGTAAESGASQLKAILLGGGPAPEYLVREARRRGFPVFCSYGLTEMSSQVTTVRPDSPPARQQTSGSLLRHRELRISDAGEILVRGHTLFLGYVEGAAVDPQRDADGWFATGDLGSLSADGYLTVTGRRDNLFISGGENIQPEEIERALSALPGIEAAVVVPVPDDEFGLRPAAFIRGAAPRDSLSAALRESLPGFMIPVAYLDFEQDAESAGGKPDRARLRALARARLSR